MSDAQKTTVPAALDSAMNTGTDDEPALTVGDKHMSDVPDPNGDGTLTVAEAETLLGGKETFPPKITESTTTVEGK